MTIFLDIQFTIPRKDKGPSHKAIENPSLHSEVNTAEQIDLYLCLSFSARYSPVTLSSTNITRSLLLRAMPWVAFAITLWSLNQRWGIELSVGKGPPGQYERHVIGAILLLFITAIVLFYTSLQKQKPGIISLALPVFTSLGALALALSIRSTAIENLQAHILLGGGWLWMSIGCSIAFGTAVAAISFRFQNTKKSVTLKNNIRNQKKKKRR